MATSSGAFVVQVGDYNIYADEDHKLGSGTFGTVYSGTYKFDEKIQVAGKKVTINAEYLDEYQKEAQLLLHTIPEHENIIKIHEFIPIPYKDRRTKKDMLDLWMIMDYGELGNLKEYAESEALTLSQKVDIIFQCSLAVNHLHQIKPESIAHRDLKPQNYVLKKCDKRVVVKLVDFGEACSVRSENERSLTLKARHGTPIYMAPEQVDNDDQTFPHDKSVDIFSLALTLLAFLDTVKGVTMTPFTMDGKNLGVAMRHMSTKWIGFSPRIDKPSDGPEQKAIKKILGLMLQAEPKDRIRITEVLHKLTAVMKNFPELGLTPSVSTPPSRTVASEESRTRSTQREAVGPRSTQREAVGPRSTQREAVGPRSTQREAVGPRSTQREAVGPRSTQREAVGPRSTQREAAGPSCAQLEAAGPSHAQPEAAGPRSTQREAESPSHAEPEASGPSGIKAPEMHHAEAAMHGLDISGSRSSSGSKSGPGAKSKHPTPHSSESTRTRRPTTDRGNIAAREAGRSSAAIEVQAIAHHKLSFTAHFNVGLSNNGDILLGKKYTRRFSLFKYEGDKYTSSMERDLPKGVKYNCSKAVSRHGDIVFQQGMDTDTLCCSSDGTVITTLQHKRLLLDSINDTLVYGCGTLLKRDWSIEIHECTVRGAYHSGRSASERQASQPVVTLKPPASHTWRAGLSICCIENTYVVVESITKSMDTFNCNGEHIHHRTLTYYPAYPHCVTAWSGHIVVVALNPLALHVHTGSGEEIISKTLHTHAQLGLDKDAYVIGIRCDSNGVLHMCVGDDASTINSLHAVKLRQV